MKLLKYLLIFCLSAVLSFQGAAQKYRYLNIGLGTILPVVKEDAMSPVKYYGIGLASRVEFRVYKEKTIFSLQGVFDIGGMSGSLNLGNSIATFSHPGFKVMKLYRFRQLGENNVYWYLGGGFSSLTITHQNPNLNNSSFIYHSFNGPRFATALSFKFSLPKHDFVLQYQAELEPFTYAFHNNYNRVFDFIDPETKEWKEILKYSGPAFTNRFLAYSWKASLLYRLSNRNAIELAYHWDYFHYNNIYNFNNANHILLASLMFNF